MDLSSPLFSTLTLTLSTALETRGLRSIRVYSRHGRKRDRVYSTQDLNVGYIGQILSTTIHLSPPLPVTIFSFPVHPSSTDNVNGPFTHHSNTQTTLPDSITHTRGHSHRLKYKVPNPKIGGRRRVRRESRVFRWQDTGRWSWLDGEGCTWGFFDPYISVTLGFGPSGIHSRSELHLYETKRVPGEFQPLLP